MKENWNRFSIHQSFECPRSTIFQKPQVEYFSKRLDSIRCPWWLLYEINVCCVFKNLFFATVLTIARHKHNDNYGFENHSSLGIQFSLLLPAMAGINGVEKMLCKKSLFRMWHYVLQWPNVNWHAFKRSIDQEQSKWV